MEIRVMVLIAVASGANACDASAPKQSSDRTARSDETDNATSDQLRDEKPSREARLTRRVRGPELPPAESLAAQLRSEAEGRPSGGHRAEAVLDAVRARSIALGKPRQFLAARIGARYCLGAVTREKTGVAVCEYRDAADANRGRERVRRELPMSDAVRTIYTYENLTLTLTRAGSTPAQAHEAHAIAKVFRSLGEQARDRPDEADPRDRERAASH